MIIDWLKKKFSPEENHLHKRQAEMENRAMYAEMKMQRDKTADCLGRVIEDVSRKRFAQGDLVKMNLENNDYLKIGYGPSDIFIRGKFAYSSDRICPKHDFRKMYDEDRKEFYCVICEQ